MKSMFGDAILKQIDSMICDFVKTVGTNPQFLYMSPGAYDLLKHELDVDGVIYYKQMQVIKAENLPPGQDIIITVAPLGEEKK